MQNQFIERKAEQDILRQALQSQEAEMVAVVGRRRVGKTFLIKETYKNELVFEVTGLQNASLKMQIQHFNFTLQQYPKDEVLQKNPVNWLEAFQQLVLYLNTLPETSK